MFNSILYLPKLKEFEGSIPYMYLDTGGNVTVGVGNLLASAADAQQLGFVTRANPRATAESATAAQIQTDFDSVNQQAPGKVASFYRQFTKLDLPDAIITSLLNSRLTDFEARLVAAFPDFNSYPDEVCAALVDMGYNLGVAGLTSKFPTFCKAVKNRDWAAAARQCHRAPPVNSDRNDWTEAQFQQAAADAAAVPDGPN